MNIWHLFSERRPQFASPNGFYSVRHRIYFPSSDYSLRTPTVFIPFTTRCILNAQFVGLTVFYSVYRRICFRSRRPGIQIRGLYRFLSKAHPYSRFIQQPKLRIPSSPYRSNHLSFPSAEVQILPFYIPFPTLYLLQQSAFSELSSISKHFIRPHIVSKYCQQQ